MSERWDVICVGAGSAGLPLAIQAAQRGARILQIDADDRIGGTLHWSSGQISAAGTRLQQRHGIDDSPDEHYEDAQRIANGQIDPTVLRLFVDNAAGLIDWLEDLGFEPAPGTPVAGEAHEPYRTRRYLWGLNAGVSVLDVLRPVHEKLVQAGHIDLRLGHRLSGLVTDDAGRVTGIDVERRHGGHERFDGANVVLASGGYAAGPELWRELTPQVPLCSYCNPFSRGDGLKAARAIGAQVDGSEKFLCTFAGVLEKPDDPTSGSFLALSPKSRNVWEIFVDGQGRRFMREDHPSIDYRERALLAQPGMAMHIVFDEGIRQNASPISLTPPEEFHAKFGRHPNYLKAPTLTALAEQLGVPAGNLEQAVAKYNRAVAEQRDDEFGREFLIRPIEKPPFFAIRACGITVLSPAGLAVDSSLRVLNESGEPIPGLYAAGEILGFGRTSGNAFVGGLSLTPALTFGKLLGERLLQW
ncbi:MAG TPA: FAD-dependent oxidoreductase [Steroidobacteraceae bacterium]|nr:FAD-dependent oxidoreductase [Steroidobacteraceae bacterium]